MLFILDYSNTRGKELLETGPYVNFSAKSGTKMMDRLPLVDADGNRRYLLEKTQHCIGGFGKGVGDPPGKLRHVHQQVAGF